MRDLLGTRLELRLGDPCDSEIDRRAAANVPEQPPGRGLTRDKLHFLAACPRIDGSRDDDDLADGDGRPGRPGCAAAWPAPPAPEGAAAAPPAAGGRAGPAGRPAGAGHPDRHQRGRARARCYLDLADEPHLIVFGDAECGKTNLLRLIARSHRRALHAGSRRGWSSSTTGAACSARWRPTHLLDYAAVEPGVRRDGSARISGAMTQPAARPGRHRRPAARPQLVEGPGAVPAGRRLRPGRQPAAATRSARCSTCCRRPATSACT